MKKTIIWSLALMMGLSLAFSGPIFAEDNNSTQGNGDAKPEPKLMSNPASKKAMTGLEKILTPDQIKNFEKIMKQGNALYGVRKGTSSVGTTTANTELKKNELKNDLKKEEKKFEKIAAPQLINLYEQIKKVGTALWGIKKEDPKRSESVGRAYVKPEMAACVIAAIESKDDSLKTANTYQATMVNEAISARTTCQKAVINSNTATTTVAVASKQKEAFNACVETFKGDMEKIREASKKSHNATWETYKTSLKACQPATSATTTTTTTAEGVLMIEDGGGSLLGD